MRCKAYDALENSLGGGPRGPTLDGTKSLPRASKFVEKEMSFLLWQYQPRTFCYLLSRCEGTPGAWDPPPPE